MSDSISYEYESSNPVDLENSLLEEDDDQAKENSEEELGSNFGASTDSFTEAPESAQHYA